MYIVWMCSGTGRGGEEKVSGVNGCDVRFSKSGGPLVETLSESKSFLKRQTLLIFLLSSIFYVYIKSKAIEKWIIKNLKICTCLKKK